MEAIGELPLTPTSSTQYFAFTITRLFMLPFFFFDSSPEDMIIDFRERETLIDCLTNTPQWDIKPAA